MNKTTSIPIVRSTEMSTKGETDTIRIPAGMMNKAGLEVGDRLRVGADKIFFVAAALPGDNDKSTAFVSVIHEELVTASAKDITPLEVDVLTIGCDPEFVLLNKTTGAVVNADHVFGGKGPLGSDAGLGEIRPAPHLDPARVVENIRELMSAAKERTDSLAIGCSCYKGWTVGFHIHFGFPKSLLLQAAENSREFIDNSIAALDYLVGIPAMLRDTSDGRRGNGVYGKPGDFRISENTLEYRVPGGYHLRSPRYTAEMLTAAYCVIEDIVGRGHLISKHWSDMSRFFSGEHFSEVYNTPDKKNICRLLTNEDRTEAQKEIPKIKDIFASTIYGYGKNSQRIDSFLSCDSRESPFIFDNWLT